MAHVSHFHSLIRRHQFRASFELHWASGTDQNDPVAAQSTNHSKLDDGQRINSRVFAPPSPAGFFRFRVGRQQQSSPGVSQPTKTTQWP